jgi:phenylalanyl-tRNA synthetase beta chain
MKISLNLLRTVIDLDWPPEKIAERLTMSGSEVEAIEKKGEGISGVISARVLSVEGVKGSDKLTQCQIDTGGEKLQVICGAPNVATGQAMLFAPIGAMLPGGTKIEKAKIHGVESFGMILSEAELGLTPEADTISVLPSDTKPGTPLEKIVNYKDIVFELEITPNRPDCLSHIGIARELQALGAGRYHQPDKSLHEISEQASKAVKIEIFDPIGCPRYTGRVIYDVKVGPSPLWLKMMVSYLGMRPINNVVDITNFVMMEFGQPLHAFDFDLFRKPEVLVRRAREGEHFITLDKIERTLTAQHLLITDSVEPVAIAGIMGGLKSEVSEDSSKVLLESAYFDPIVIRRGSKALGLSTESSRRFERGADPQIAPVANDRAAKLISEIAQGKVLQGIVDAHPKPFVPVQIELRPSRVERLLGAKIDKKKISQILTDLEINNKANDNIVAMQPSFRPDLVREVDLIEEIARVYGFDNIPPFFRPGGSLATPMTRQEKLKDKIRNYLSGSGASEIFPLTLGDQKLAEKLGILEESVRLVNPISEDMGVARPNLILTLLPIIRRNLGFRETNLTLFEIGNVYHHMGKGKLPTQSTHLALAITGMELPDFWGQRWPQRDLFSLKGMLEDLADYLQAGTLTISPAPYFAFDKDHSFDVYLSGKKLGVMGKLSEKASDLADIKLPAFVAELNFDDLMEVVPESISAKELAKYPSADRDIAIVVDDAVMASDIEKEIKAAGMGLVDEVWIFDLYRGKNIPSDKKSLAFGIKYRLPDRTLTDEEVNEAQGRITAALEKRFGAQLRT